ncbi:unnamed protein product [Allacma fusca]|uniref:Uncharacterized protein n=1 Tax=Allacma fusca TaxID=39272 RepID=A0A8J2JRQ9_9HEXA|nr:unnamed protein product [Allacma fusca]
MITPRSPCFLRVLLVIKLRRRRRQRKRGLYLRPILSNRIVQGELSLVQELAEDPYYHHRYFRMKKDTFQHILQLIEDDIQHGHNHSRPISPLERLAITLRYLATGNSQHIRIKAPPGSGLHWLTSEHLGHVLTEEF